MRAAVETIVGVVALVAAVIGVSYIVEAKHARQRAAEVARK